MLEYNNPSKIYHTDSDLIEQMCEHNVFVRFQRNFIPDNPNGVECATNKLRNIVYTPPTTLKDFTSVFIISNYCKMLALRRMRACADAAEASGHIVVLKVYSPVSSGFCSVGSLSRTAILNRQMEVSVQDGPAQRRLYREYLNRIGERQDGT